jgi:hypothetical protein
MHQAGKKSRLGVALGAAVLLAAMSAGSVLAGGECTVTVEPSTVAVGDEFVVSGDFGANAEIHLVRGVDQAFPEDSEPVATIPIGESSFRLTFTAEAGDEGSWTVWAFIFGTECGDSASLTITPATQRPAATPTPALLPDTAVSQSPTVEWTAFMAISALFLAMSLVLLTGRGIKTHG